MTNPYEPSTFEETRKSEPRRSSAFVVFCVTVCMFVSSLMFFSTMFPLGLRAPIGISVTVALATLAYEMQGSRTQRKSQGKKVYLFVLLTFAVSIISIRESTRQKSLREAAERMQRNQTQRQDQGNQKP